MEKREPSYHCWWECKWMQPLCKTVWRFLKKLKIDVPYDPAILFLCIYPEKQKYTNLKRYMHPNVYSSIIYKSQDMNAVHQKIIGLRKYVMGLPWWCSGWESACRYGGHGFEPWSWQIPHATEQLGPWATVTEPAHLEPVLCNKRGHDSERPVHRDEEWPLLATTRESPRTETRNQHSQK